MATALLQDDDYRVVLHFDLDAFYVACERELNPALRGLPVAVSQYNPYGDLTDRSLQDIHGRWVVQANPVVRRDDHDAAKTPPFQTTGGGDTNGSLIAVSYEARASGVKRNQRGKEACQACPALNIVQVPVKHGKADLTLYRSASKRVMEALRRAVVTTATEMLVVVTKNANNQTKTIKDLESDIIVEIASIDEVYIDVTKLANRLVERIQSSDKNFASDQQHLWQTMIDAAGTCTTIGGIEVLSEAALATNALAKDELRRGSHVQVLDNKVDPGSQAWWNRNISMFDVVQLRLVCGAYLAAKARALVQSSFDGGVFTLSAGISTNKTLAKLASGLKKPNRQTLIYRDQRVLLKLFHPLPLGRIRGLGGKFGDSIANQLQIETVGQLAELPLTQLQQVSKNAQFLYDISRGLCTDPVTPRSKPKSIECSKTFRGPLAIPVNDRAKLEKWMGELCNQLVERLQEDKDEYHRMPSTMKVSVQFHCQKSFLSKQMRAPRSFDAYQKAALDMIQNLIQSTQKKMPSSAPDCKNLRITGMGVGGTQFVDIAEGSSSILAFATPMASSAKSPSTAAGATVQKPSLQEERRFVMDSWLRKSQNDTPRSSIDRAYETKRAKKSHPTTSASGSILQQMMLSGKQRSSESSSTNHSHKPAISMPRMDEIDPEVLKELPEDIQRAVLGDIRFQHSQRQTKKRGIKSFFEPRSRSKSS